MDISVRRKPRHLAAYNCFRNDNRVSGAPTMKKFSQPWNIVVLKPEAAPFMGIIRRARRYYALFADFLRSFTPPGDV